MDEECGHLIGGDPDRPCVRRLGHKTVNHRDAAYREWDLARKRERHAAIAERDNARRRAQYAANRERELENKRAYWATNRDLLRDKSRRWHYANREYANDKSRQYHAGNRERLLEQMRAYRIANPEKIRQLKSLAARRRRARKNQVPQVDYTREQLIETYGSDCYICRKPLPEDWHVEHVIPLSRGGWDVLTNVRPACPSDNLSKQAKMPPAILQMRIWWELGVHRAGVVCGSEPWD